MAENPPRIPSMNEILESCAQRGLESFGREACRAACSRALDGVRALRKAGEPQAGVDAAFWTQVSAFLQVLPSLQLRGAINATGVVLHTNLGRAPWPQEAVDAAAAVAGASLCEIDRKTGGRGRRDRPVSELLARVTGAEAGLPVNNNAATVLLAVSALARGRKVVVARSELVEIGGSYRMPEVIAAAGAEMVEVGTTNRVHLKDFETAMEDPAVSLVLRIHPSNFRIEGFTTEPAMQELANACHARGLPLVYDLGSGVLNGTELGGLENEHSVQKSLADGCDLVTFSGDKLLGGPQAGLIVGANRWWNVYAATCSRVVYVWIKRFLPHWKRCCPSTHSVTQPHARGFRRCNAWRSPPRNCMQLLANLPTPSIVPQMVFAPV